MLVERIEKLKQEYVDQEVVVESDRPQLRRFAGKSGRVRTLNRNGRALVEFAGADRGWYDIELDYVRVVEPHEPKTVEATASTSDAPAQATEQSQPTLPEEAPPSEKLSRLELARMEKGTSHS